MLSRVEGLIFVSYCVKVIQVYLGEDKKHIPAKAAEEKALMPDGHPPEPVRAA